MSAAKHISDLVMRKSTKQLNSSVKIMLLNKCLHLAHSFTVSSYYEMNIFKLCQYFRYNSNEEVNTFPISKPRYEYNIDLVWVA